MLLFMVPVCISAHEDVGFVLAVSMLMIGVGGNVYNILNGIRIKKIKKIFREKKLKFGFNSEKNFIFSIYLIGVLSITGSIYYFMNVGISLFAEEVGLERLLSRHAVTGSYLYQRLFRVFLPVLCLIYYIYVFNIGRGNKYILYVLILITSSLLIFTGMRGNIITFIFTPFIILMGLISDKVSIKALLSLFIMGVVGGMLISALMYKNSDLIFLLILILERLGGGASDGITLVIQNDVIENGYYYGETWINDIISIFSKLGYTSTETLNYSAHIARLMLGDRYNGEQAAVYIFGEFYANFGFYGNVVGSFIIGAILQKIYINAFETKKTILRLACYSYFHASLILIIGGPSSSMAIDYIITIGALYLLISLLSSRPKMKPSNILMKPKSYKLIKIQ